MRDERKRAAARTIILGALLLLLFIIQATVTSRLPIFGAKPIILPLAVCAVALFYGPISGGIFGIFAGILTDISFNEPTILFTIVLTLAGLAVGYMAQTVLMAGFPAYILTALGTTLFCTFVQAAPILFTDSAAFAAILNVSLRQLISSMLFSVPLYLIVSGLRKLV